MRRKVLVRTLAVLAVFQGGLLAKEQITGYRVERFAVGEPLPFSINGPLEEGWVGHPSGGCIQAFVCTTNCPYCAKLARRYVDSLHETTAEALRPIWMILGDSAGAYAWAGEHNILRSQVVWTSPRVTEGVGRDVVGRVWFTPMRLVLTDSQTVKDARPADDLLDHDLLRTVCERGGAAPQSIDDMRELYLSGRLDPTRPPEDREAGPSAH